LVVRGKKKRSFPLKEGEKIKGFKEIEASENALSAGKTAVD
jgi:hypothetical protein